MKQLKDTQYRHSFPSESDVPQTVIATKLESDKASQRKIEQIPTRRLLLQTAQNLIAYPRVGHAVALVS